MIGVIVFIIGGVLLIGVHAYDSGTKATRKEEKKEKRFSKWQSRTILVIGVIALIAGLFLFFTKGIKYGTTETMRQRINEPVISEAQLYGYEIIGKHVENSIVSSDSSQNINYFFDLINGLLPGKNIILKKVNVTEELFKRNEIHDYFNDALIGERLKIPELQPPDPQDL